MNIELKPCPFCGGKAEARISPNSRSEEGESFYEVRCKKCGVHVTGKSFNFWTVEYNAEKPQDLLSAVNRWNKRASETSGRKTGKWVDINGNALPINEFGSPKGNAWCSVCNHLLFGSDSKQIPDGNYCPYCGVKMEVDNG